MSPFSALSDVDLLLRGRGAHAPGRASVPWLRLIGMLAASGLAYGAVMGAWGGRVLQSTYSGIKVPLFLVVSTLVCLPNFFAVNAVLGLRDDFSAAMRGVLSTQAIVAVCLAGLAPLTGLVYWSGISYSGAMVANGAAFALASLGGQIALARHYRPLIARDRRHRLGLRAWLFLYWFVAIQLAWVLRPFVGAQNLDPTFLRPNAWGNAYVQVANAIWRAFGGE